MTNRPAKLGVLALAAFVLAVLVLRIGQAAPATLDSSNASPTFPVLEKGSGFPCSTRGETDGELDQWDRLPLSCAPAEDHSGQFRARPRQAGLKSHDAAAARLADGSPLSWPRWLSRCSSSSGARLHVLLCTWLT